MTTMLTNDKVDPNVRDIIARLVENGHEAYVVGGAIRDILLGISPKDYDIATSATPREVKRIFGKKARLIGRRFRLAHIYFGRKYYEVSTFRREPTSEERSTRDGDDGTIIWQDNIYGNLEEDVYRRDFTLNALYADPLNGVEIIDKVGGLEDIDQRVVRTINDPDTRIAEDPVRIIRALKMVAQYDFRLEPGLDKALEQRKAEIRKSSVSRLFEELLKIYSGNNTVKTLQVFHDYGLLAYFLPELDKRWETEIGDVMRRLLAERDRRKAAREWYSNSRVLALITTAFPFIAEEMGTPTIEDIAAYQPELPSRVTSVIRNLFAPLPVPKRLTARARDAVLLLPKFTTHDHQNRLLHHPEYRYARELLSLLTTVMEWDETLVNEWPENGKWRSGSRSGGPPGRRRRKNPGQRHVQSANQRRNQG
ncbi:MAG: polynucleotide adenylyltransferase PcnB [Lentisphaeria bacterium]